jgi:hypothetical protein
MMEIKFKIAISTLVICLVVLVVILFTRYKPEDVYKSLNEVFNPKKEEGGQSTPTFQPTKKENRTTQTSTTELPPPAGLPPGGSTSGSAGEQQPESASKALTLEIIDICSGKFEDVFIISEGMQHCLNIKSPYFVLLEKNSTHIQTDFYNLTGFKETYLVNDSALIFFLFAEDVASVSKIIQSFYIEGNPNFYLGDYDLHTIWERDASGNLFISKMIVALPLYVTNNISLSNDWSELKFYLNITNKNYYLGNLWFLVKQK